MILFGVESITYNLSAEYTNDSALEQDFTYTLISEDKNGFTINETGLKGTPVTAGNYTFNIGIKDNYENEITRLFNR